MTSRPVRSGCFLHPKQWNKHVQYAWRYDPCELGLGSAPAAPQVEVCASDDDEYLTDDERVETADDDEYLTDDERVRAWSKRRPRISDVYLSKYWGMVVYRD